MCHYLLIYAIGGGLRGRLMAFFSLKTNLTQLQGSGRTKDTLLMLSNDDRIDVLPSHILYMFVLLDEKRFTSEATLIILAYKQPNDNVLHFLQIIPLINICKHCFKTCFNRITHTSHLKFIIEWYVE